MRAACLFVLLASCAPPPTLVAPTRAHIDLRAVTMAEADPLVRARCTESIRAALTRHGFLFNPGGNDVRIEAAFWADPNVGALASEDNSGAGSMLGAGRMETAPTRFAYTADLTATLDLGGPPTKVMGTGHGEVVEAANSPLLHGPEARISACSAAAERLAAAMVEAVGQP